MARCDTCTRVRYRWENSKEASFLNSALATESRFQNLGEFFAWFKSRHVFGKFVVKPIPFTEMDQWHFTKNPHRLAHTSGMFFTVDGIRVRAKYISSSEWDQPIIDQSEIGILGIITKVFDGLRYFLMQAKMEPGNINVIQLAPTVQATKSNYMRIHGGKLPAYLKYFLDRSKARILIEQLQHEHSNYFLRKRNRNIIVEVTEELPIYDDFCWLTLGQLKELLIIDNLVNMDARSVLSCIRFCTELYNRTYIMDHCQSDYARDIFLSMLDHSSACQNMDELVSWFTELRTRYEISVERIPLKELRQWVQTDSEIRYEKGSYFSIIPVLVQASNREVSTWTQPLIGSSGHGLVGFLTQKHSGIIHFLVQVYLRPGALDMIEMGPTIVYSEGGTHLEQCHCKNRFLSLFLNASAEHIRYSVIQSEDGGRFYHYQNRYMILELPPKIQLSLSESFAWMTLEQIMEFSRYGYFNIEARSLIACLNLLGK